MMTMLMVMMPKSRIGIIIWPRLVLSMTWEQAVGLFCQKVRKLHWLPELFRWGKQSCSRPHIWMDHPSTLVHASHTILNTTNGKNMRTKFQECVSHHKWSWNDVVNVIMKLESDEDVEDKIWRHWSRRCDESRWVSDRSDSGDWSVASLIFDGQNLNTAEIIGYTKKDKRC